MTIAPPVDTPTVALPAAAELVLGPAPKENDPVAAALLVINVVAATLLLPAGASVSVPAAAAEVVVFHMYTLGWEVTTLGMPVMTPREFVWVVKEVKPLVYGKEEEEAAGTSVGAWGWPSLIWEMAFTVAT